MSSTVGPGLFGRTDKRDYVSMLPIWHSCFVLHHLLPLEFTHGYDYFNPMHTNFEICQKIGNNNLFATGSAAEGLSVDFLTGIGSVGTESDADFMINNFQGYKAGYDPSKCNLELLDTDPGTHPGYALLKLPNQKDKSVTLPRASEFCLPNSIFQDELHTFAKKRNEKWYSFLPSTVEKQGPASTVKMQGMPDEDLLFVIPCLEWPHVANQWPERERRNKWLPSQLINEIKSVGCHLVPTAHPQSKNPNYEWRISFSIAEKMIAKTLSYHQRLCYLLFKIAVKNSKTCIKTYHCKTILFWACEEVPNKFWQTDTILQGVIFLLDKLLHSLVNHNLPHYFIPNNNLLSAIPKELIRDVAKDISKIRTGPVDQIFQASIPYLEKENSISSEILWDFNEHLNLFTKAVSSASEFTASFLDDLRCFNIASLVGDMRYDLSRFSGTLASVMRLTGQWFAFCVLQTKDGPKQLLFHVAQRAVENTTSPEHEVLKCFPPEVELCVSLKLAEIYHQILNEIKAVKVDLETEGASANVQEKVDYLKRCAPGFQLNQQSMTEQYEHFIEMTDKLYCRLLTDVKECATQVFVRYNTIRVKYANFLYQTDKDLKKAYQLLQDIESESDRLLVDDFVIFHKDESLTTDDHLRIHLRKRRCLILPLLPITFYLQTMIGIKLKAAEIIKSGLVKLIEPWDAEQKDRYKLEIPERCMVGLSLLGHVYYALRDWTKAKDAFMKSNEHWPTLEGAVLAIVCAILEIFEYIQRSARISASQM